MKTIPGYIKLTTTSGNPVFINTEKIESITLKEEDTHEKQIWIVGTTGEDHEVTESIDEIIDELTKHAEKASMRRIVASL